jgi:hypothetical protein
LLTIKHVNKLRVDSVETFILFEKKTSPHLRVDSVETFILSEEKTCQQPSTDSVLIRETFSSHISTVTIKYHNIPARTLLRHFIPLGNKTSAQLRGESVTYTVCVMCRGNFKSRWLHKAVLPPNPPMCEVGTLRGGECFVIMTSIYRPSDTPVVPKNGPDHY